ncbi:MAG: hypothetical protein M0R66_02510 [Candidatus Omnitrophica bacterium]|nr:hypothetical protein [Sphaerochaeta sp.]MCK9603240.1 hypothetical protein [Candidatus Omnitrophota bacterium]
MDLVNLANSTVVQREKSFQREDHFNNPVKWAEQFLGVKLWTKQAEVAMALVDNKNVVVKAGHEVGKSWLAGLLICWWIDTRWDKPGGCFVVSTAPSTKQINAIVWREVRKFYNLAKKRYEAGEADHMLPGYITADAHWRLPDGIELGYGSKPPEGSSSEDGTDTMSGIHARYVLAVGDEAVGLSKGLIGDLANITSNATSRRFLICNPTNPLSYVASIFKRKLKSWYAVTISVFDSPNFHGGEGFGPEVLETLVDQSYVDDIIDEHGLDSPTYTSRVLGEFAWDMGYTLIRPEDVAMGFDTDIEPSPDSSLVLGVDVSRSKAGDKNTAYAFRDGVLRFIDSWNEPNAINTANHIHRLAVENLAVEVRIDGVGLGGPIADYVREVAQREGAHYEIIEILGGDRSPDPKRWYNFRAWMYWHFKERLSRGEIDLDVEDDKLQEQLLGIEIKKRLSGNDTLLLESKEEMRKRGVSSPDHADAAIYAAIDLTPWTGNPWNALTPGSVIAKDPAEFGMQDIHWDAIEF